MAGYMGLPPPLADMAFWGLPSNRGAGYLIAVSCVQIFLVPPSLHRWYGLQMASSMSLARVGATTACKKMLCLGRWQALFELLTEVASDLVLGKKMLGPGRCCLGFYC